MQLFLDWIRKLILMTVLIVSGIMLVHIIIVTVGTHFEFWQTDKTPFYAALLAFIYYIVPLAALLLIYLMISELIYIETSLTYTITTIVSEKAVIRAERQATIQAIKEAKAQSIKESKEAKAKLAKETKEAKAQLAKEAKEAKMKFIQETREAKKLKASQKNSKNSTTTHEPLSLKNKLFRKNSQRNTIPPQV